jgi:D-3-phosphoglycerate dehydrogenase
VFVAAFAQLETEHRVTYLQLDGARAFTPRTRSERRISEYAGSPGELSDRMAGTDVLVVHGAPVTREVLESSDSLKLVCCARGGPLNVDVEAASALGIPVVTTPGKNAEAVADQTIWFLLTLARRFSHAVQFVAAGAQLGASNFEGLQFFGHELRNHVLGLVGYGRVGHCVARRCVAFGLRVVVFDPFVEVTANEHIEQVTTLEQLLSTADFVSLHARATPENENLMGAEAFARMKRGALLVNTARETLVDESALAAALASGQLAGAALDVVRPYPGGSPHPLLSHDNVVITPHVGGATHETLQRGASMLAEEIKRFSHGEDPINMINRATIAP